MTPAEKRDATLRTVQLPDCCGNCQYHWSDMGGSVCEYMERIHNEYPFPSFYVHENQLCDLHARKPDGGNG